MAEFRVKCPNCSKAFCTQCNKEPYHLGYTCEEAERYANASHCRFCLEELNQPSKSKIPAFRACCDQEECLKIAEDCCTKQLACGHFCNGAKGEKTCLPCLQPECIQKYNEKNPADKIHDGYSEGDYCGICMTSGLGQEACVRLGNCGHIFHYNCILRKVGNKWPSPRMTFDFMNCSVCKLEISCPQNPNLHSFLTKLKNLKTDMENKAVAKARVEGIDKDPRLHDDFQGDLKKWAVYKCAYYLCYTCNKPYFGGMKDCIRA